MKTCTGCKELKSKADFYRDKRASDGLCFRCKKCSSESCKSWKAANQELVRKMVYAWRKENPDASHAINAKSRKKHHARVMVDNGKRRAKEDLATPRWANKDAMKEFYETAKGLSMLLGEAHHVDHIVPLNSQFVCGLHVEHNMQVIPASANFLKNNRFWPDMPSIEIKP